MIAFVRGPGGFLRRAVAELVPFGVGAFAAGVALAVVPPWAALLGGLVAWVVASFVLRAVRRRTWPRRIYRVAVLAHVVFWTIQGFSAQVHEPAGPVRALAGSTWLAHSPFLAGYAERAFALPAHAVLGGWGTRPRRLRWPPFGGLGPVGDVGRRWMGARPEGAAARLPLLRTPADDVPGHAVGARAVVIRPTKTENGSPHAIVRLDLVTSDASLAAAIHARVADLGFSPAGLLVAATHTHSGPGGFSRQPLSIVAGTGHFDPETFDALATAASDAVRAAFESAVPAELTVLRGRDRDAGGAPVLARSRRADTPDDIDDRVLVLRLAAASDGAPVAALLNYAVHPVQMRRGHLGWHRDLAGALEDALQARLPGRPPVLFLNGAPGDVAPRDAGLPVATRTRDLAEGFAEQLVANLESGPTVRRLRVASSRVVRRLARPHLVLTRGDRGAWLDAHGPPLWESGAAAIAARAIALPVNMLVWSLGLPEVRVGFHWDGSVGATVDLDRLVPDRDLHQGAVVIELDGGRRVALLWTAAEGTQALGRAWRAGAARRGFADALVAGFVNGASGYVTTASEYRHDTYDARASLFGDGAGAAASEALDEALAWAARQLDGE